MLMSLSRKRASGVGQPCRPVSLIIIASRHRNAALQNIREVLPPGTTSAITLAVVILHRRVTIGIITGSMQEA